MTPEEAKKKAEAERKKLYRQRKKQEELAHQASPEELTTMFNEQARNIAPELEEAFRNAKGNSQIRPSHQDHREQAQAVISEVEERHHRVELIMANYRKDAANANNLLWHILETLTLMRLELTDLVGGLRK